MGIFFKPTESASSIATRLLLESCGAVGVLTKPFGYRGLNRYCKIGGSIIHGSAQVRVHKDVLLEIPTSDPYWLSVTPRCRTYEPEIEGLLRMFSRDRVTFIDGGANVGYWSILAARNPGWRVLAVEAAQKTFERLRMNVGLNRVDVTVLNRAVSEKGGGEVIFETVNGNHAGAHIAESSCSLKEGSECVMTTSVNEIAVQYQIGGLVILKLDVEGHELQALKGAEKVLQGSALVIYEEHGSRPTCAPTQALIAGGCSAFFLTKSGLKPMKSHLELIPHLRNSGTGYNVVASRCPEILRRLEAAVP